MWPAIGSAAASICRKRIVGGSATTRPSLPGARPATPSALCWLSRWIKPRRLLAPDCRWRPKCRAGCGCRWHCSPPAVWLRWRLFAGSAMTFGLDRANRFPARQMAIVASLLAEIVVGGGQGSPTAMRNSEKSASGNACGDSRPPDSADSAEIIEASYDFCRRVCRRAGSNFLGLSVASAEKRRAMNALYAFMRHTDDLADRSAGRRLAP